MTTPEEHKTSPLISMRNIHKIYGEGNTRVHALRSVEFEVQRGEFVAVMGPSGSGKSTCMNIVGCLDVPSKGSYEFSGVEVASLNHEELAMLRRHYLGFVFQSFNLLARTNALKNVELPLVYKGIKKRDRAAMALGSLRDVGLAERADHTPAQLSGGQQQRVAIARALVTRPKLLLADEPTGNLDTTTSEEILTLMRKLNQERNLTIMMVTHEPETARHADRVLIFVDGQIVQDGPPEIVLDRASGGYH
jgi:putative ABC transport system ATP-binding protein